MPGHQVGGSLTTDGDPGTGLGKIRPEAVSTLEPGMVFTIEPRLTVPGRGVATIEDMILVTETDPNGYPIRRPS